MLATWLRVGGGIGVWVVGVGVGVGVRIGVRAGVRVVVRVVVRVGARVRVSAFWYRGR